MSPNNRVLPTGASSETRLQEAINNTEGEKYKHLGLPPEAKFIDKGGFGLVFRLYVPDLDREVAIKVFPTNSNAIFASNRPPEIVALLVQHELKIMGLLESYQFSHVIPTKHTPIPDDMIPDDLYHISMELHESDISISDIMFENISVGGKLLNEIAIDVQERHNDWFVNIDPIGNTLVTRDSKGNYQLRGIDNGGVIKFKDKDTQEIPIPIDGAFFKFRHVSPQRLRLHLANQSHRDMDFETASQTEVYAWASWIFENLTGYYHHPLARKSQDEELTETKPRSNIELGDMSYSEVITSLLYKDINVIDFESFKTACNQKWVLSTNDVNLKKIYNQFKLLLDSKIGELNPNTTPENLLILTQLIETSSQTAAV